MLILISVLAGLVKHGVGPSGSSILPDLVLLRPSAVARPRSQQEGPARAAE